MVGPDDGCPSVWVVVVTWNGWEMTRRCLEHIAALRHPNTHVVLVDNGSDVAHDADSLPVDTLIRSETNLGYAGGSNLGLERALGAGAEYVWILNDDAAPEPDALTELVAAAGADQRIGALTTSVVEDGGLARYVAHVHTPAWDLFARSSLLGCDGCEAGFHQALIRGPSLFFRAAALSEVGLFTTTYFHYFEDIDLVERVRHAGWRVGLACRAHVHHAKGHSLSYSTSQALYYLFRNDLLFRRAVYGDHPFRVLRRHPWRVLRHVLAVRSLARGDTRPTIAHVLAIVDAVRGRSGPRPLSRRHRAPLRR